MDKEGVWSTEARKHQEQIGALVSRVAEVIAVIPSISSDDEGKSGYRKGLFLLATFYLYLGGYHPVQIGDRYKDRYVIEKKLGPQSACFFLSIW